MILPDVARGAVLPDAPHAEPAPARPVLSLAQRARSAATSLEGLAAERRALAALVLAAGCTPEAVSGRLVCLRADREGARQDLQLLAGAARDVDHEDAEHFERVAAEVAAHQDSADGNELWASVLRTFASTLPSEVRDTWPGVEHADCGDGDEMPEAGAWWPS